MALINASAPTGRRRVWLTAGGLVLLAILGYLAILRWDKYWKEEEGRSLLDRGEFAEAAAALGRASAKYPQDQELAFLAAVAYRRAGASDEFESHLRRAERLGLSEDKVRLQRLLFRTQNGLGDAASEAALKDFCLKNPDDFTAEQVYEAMAKGYLSTYQVVAAEATLNYWIQWKRDAPIPRFLRADIAEQQDDMPTAEKDYRAVLAAHPNNVEALIRLARLLAARHNQEESLTLLRRCAELSPGDPRATVAIAEIEYARGEDASKVERELDQALSANLDVPLRSRTWQVLAEIYLDRKEYQKVIDLLEEAAEQKEVDAPCYQALIRAHFALGHKERADHFRKVQQEQLRLLNEAREMDRLICSQPSDPEPRFRRGQISLEAGREQDAMTWWYTALLADPLHQPSHEALAKLFLAKGDAHKAAQHQASAEQSVERTFERAWTEYTRENLGYVRAAIPDIAKYPEYRPQADLLAIAMEIHQRQRQLDPARVKKLESLLDYPRLRKYALVVLGSALFHLGQFGPAEQALLEALRQDPRSIQAHRWLVAMYKDIRDLDRMYQHCQEWAALDPTDYRPHRLIGLESKARMIFDVAVTSYSEALRRNPPPKIRQEILNELAECQFDLAQPQAAIKSLEDAEVSVARDILLSRCYWELRREDEAKSLLEDCLKRDPKNRFGNLLRADIAAKEEQFELAAKHLELVLEEYPFDDAGWYKLSQVYSSLKQLDKARECGAKSAQLRAAVTAYNAAIEKAYREPENAGIRRELAARARQIGRPDLAEEWERAAQLLETLTSSGVSPVTDPKKESSPANAIPLIEPKTNPVAPPDAPKR